MAIVKPIYRIFDYNKTIEFYINWLGFKIDWEHKHKGGPIYLQVSLGDIVLHLTEHHGDCTPGARIHVEDFKDCRTIIKNWLKRTIGLINQD